MGLEDKRKLIAAKAVNKIVRDLTDRGGLQNAWDDIDNEIQEEIRETWEEIIKEELNKGEKTNG